MLSYDILLLTSGLFLAAYGVYLFVTVLLSTNTDKEALIWASGEEPERSSSWLLHYSRPLVHNFTLGHAQKVRNEKYRQKVEKKILTAGLSSELNVNEFIGLQILWGVAFPILLFIFNFALQLGWPWLFIVGFGLLGFYFPHLYCNRCKKERMINVLSEMPFFVDILALSTEAGLDFIGCLQRILDKMQNDSVLAQEIQNVLKDIKLGSSRRDALTAMSKRLDMHEITSFITVLLDADQTGVGIATVLKQQSIQMRADRFVRAEKAGSRASVMILIPMMMFIVPAVFIIVLAPAALNMFYGGN